MRLEPEFVLDALDYPGCAASRPGVVRPGVFAPLPSADELERMITGRRPVLAIGANADPRVLHAKLCAAGAEPLVPVWPCTVTGLAIGHSAHVAVRGYLPAAPFHAPGWRSEVQLGWLTAAQVTAVDATEPNYVRTTLRADRYPLDGAPPADRYDVYVSRWGLVAGPDGAPLKLTRQPVLRAAGSWPHQAGPWPGPWSSRVHEHGLDVA